MMCQSRPHDAAEAPTPGAAPGLGALLEHVADPPAQPCSSRPLPEELPWQMNPAIPAPPGSATLGWLPSALVLFKACRLCRSLYAWLRCYIVMELILGASLKLGLYGEGNWVQLRPLKPLPLFADEQDHLAGGAYSVAGCAVPQQGAPHRALPPAGKIV